jgi:hypothetical protein
MKTNKERLNELNKKLTEVEAFLNSAEVKAVYTAVGDARNSETFPYEKATWNEEDLSLPRHHRRDEDNSYYRNRNRYSEPGYSDRRRENEQYRKSNYSGYSQTTTDPLDEYNKSRRGLLKGKQQNDDTFGEETNRSKRARSVLNRVGTEDSKNDRNQEKSGSDSELVTDTIVDEDEQKRLLAALDGKI